MISIIIPALNEAAHLPATLEALRGQGETHEVLVIDAQSTDATAAVARAGGARVLCHPTRQRASQLNAGAAAARGETLLFLHADTRLPDGALAAVRRALTPSAVLGGGFARRYEPGSPLLRMTCALAELRTRCFGWFLGDQAMFVRRAAFEDLGGFQLWDAFEDLDFARRLARTGRVVTLRPPVISADRRFAKRGPLRTTWQDFLLTLGYLAKGHPSGAAPRMKEILAESLPTLPR